MDALLNRMRGEALRAGAALSPPRIGIVTHYDPNNFAVKVALQPDQSETGWLPLMSPWVGNGWGMFAAPSLNDQIEVQFQEGSIEAGFACLRFYTDQNRPLPVPSGEFWIQHKTGSFVKFHNDGSVELVTAGDLNATVGGNLNATIDGNLNATVEGNSTLSLQAASLTATSMNVTCPETTWTGNISLVGVMSLYGLTTLIGTAGSGEAVFAAPIKAPDMTIVSVGSVKNHFHNGVETGSGSTDVMVS